MNSEKILEIRDLHTSFFTDKGVVRAVNGVDLEIGPGQIVGLVGESGCGKSMTARSVMGLVRFPGKIESGSIRLNGKELTGLTEKELRSLCGDEVSMIFQEPMTSLNPVLRVGRQVQEAVLVHNQSISRKDARKQVIDMFERVGIPEPEQRYNCYPHELSGGLRQRVMIAMAMICRPRLLIADEPTTALDVTIETQILNLMQQLCRETQMSVLIITHNLGIVAEICDYVYVMYAGRIVEHAPVFELFDHPAHPYTRGLMASIPQIGRNPEYLHTIPGVVPNLLHLGEGCAFAGRCDCAVDRCSRELPEMVHVREDHASRCFIISDAEFS